MRGGCGRENKETPLNCREAAQTFKLAVAAVEKVSLVLDMYPFRDWD